MKMLNLNRAILATGVLGVVIATYTLHVEMSATKPDYKAFCDLSEGISCSKVLTSEFAKGFGLVPRGSLFDIPNCIFGIIFYCIMILMAPYDHMTLVWVQLILAVISNISSVYLAYLLIFVLKDFCLICASSYIVNAVLVLLIYKKYDNLAKKVC